MWATTVALRRTADDIITGRGTGPVDVRETKRVICKRGTRSNTVQNGLRGCSQAIVR